MEKWVGNIQDESEASGIPRSKHVLKKKIHNDEDVKGTKEPNEEGPNGQHCNNETIWAKK